MTKPPASAAQPPGKAWHSQSIEEVLAQRGSDIMQAIALPSPGGMSVSVVTRSLSPTHGTPARV